MARRCGRDPRLHAVMGGSSSKQASRRCSLMEGPSLGPGGGRGAACTACRAGPVAPVHTHESTWAQPVPCSFKPEPVQPTINSLIETQRPSTSPVLARPDRQVPPTCGSCVNRGPSVRHAQTHTLRRSSSHVTHPLKGPERSPVPFFGELPSKLAAHS